MAEVSVALAERPRAGAYPSRSVDRVARHPGRGYSWALFIVSFLGYAVPGAVLSLHYNLIDGDGPSRVADAGYVIFSRDPHLGAVGFIWNPLPSAVELPLLLFRAAWPELLDHGQAGTIQSALFMAGAVLLVRAIAIDRGVPGRWRWVFVGAFALNPMIVEFGGNGLSEASYTFFTLLAARSMLRWVDDRVTTHLMAAGCALAVGYLARYEEIPAAAAAAVAVVLIGLAAERARSRRSWRSWRSVCSDSKFALHAAGVLLFPIVATVLMWAVVSWLLTGQLFPQFTSEYGNSAQLGVATASVHTGSVLAVLRDMVGMEPLLLLIVGGALVIAVVRRQPAILMVLAVFGGPLAFEAAAQLKGVTFGWFRFYVLIVPLTVLAMLTAFTGLTGDAANEVATATSRRRPTSPLVAGMLSVLMFLPSFPVTLSSMLDAQVGNQPEQFALAAVLHPSRAARYQVYLRSYVTDRALANYLDSLQLPSGSVLMDTFQGWPIWIASARQRQFVVTSDGNFTRALNDPSSQGVRYVLVPDPQVGNAALDAVNRRYPSMWASGAGLASLSSSWAGTTVLPAWRLYEVNGLR